MLGSNASWLIAISCDGFSQFELTQPNAEWKLQTIDIWLCHWCWCMVRLTQRSSTLRVIVMYPLFIAGHDTMPKTFPSLPLFTWDETHSMSFIFNLYGNQCPCFWIIPNALKRFKTVLWSTPNDSTSSVCVWHEPSWNKASNYLSSKFFSAPECSLSSTSKPLFFKYVN